MVNSRWSHEVHTSSVSFVRRRRPVGRVWRPRGPGASPYARSVPDLVDSVLAVERTWGRGRRLGCRPRHRRREPRPRPTTPTLDASNPGAQPAPSTGSAPSTRRWSPGGRRAARSTRRAASSRGCSTAPSTPSTPLDATARPPTGGPLLDPSCGSGHFLVAAAARLVARGLSRRTWRSRSSTGSTSTRSRSRSPGCGCACWPAARRRARRPRRRRSRRAPGGAVRRRGRQPAVPRPAAAHRDRASAGRAADRSRGLHRHQRRLPAPSPSTLVATRRDCRAGAAAVLPGRSRRRSGAGRGAGAGARHGLLVLARAGLRRHRRAHLRPRRHRRREQASRRRPGTARASPRPRRSADAAGEWGPLAAVRSGHPASSATAHRTATLGDLGSAPPTSATSTTAWCRSSPSGGTADEAPARHLRPDRPGRIRWGRVPTRFAKTRYAAPTVDLDALHADGALERLGHARGWCRRCWSPPRAG